MHAADVALIVNPIAGGGLAVRNLPQIEKTLRSLGVQVHIFQTQYQGHASELALSFSSQSKLRAVIAAGGDGTVNEVAAGLIGSPTPLGIVPMGSGNGLGRQLGISRNIGHACRIIAEGTPRVIDSGEMNGRPFFVTSGIGFDGLVASHFATSKKRGLLRYVSSTLNLIRALEPFEAEIEAEGLNGTERQLGRYSVIVAANAEQYGNNAYVAPGAMLDDGLLNLTTIGPARMLQLASLGQRLFNRTLAGHSLVGSQAATQIQVSTQKAQFYHLDGEPCGMDSSFNILVRPGSLRVLTPLRTGFNLTHV